MVILGSDGAEKTFTVPLKDDVLFEDEEGFKVHLSSTDTAVQVVSPSTANVFIVDNDGKSCCTTPFQYLVAKVITLW